MSRPRFGAVCVWLMLGIGGVAYAQDLALADLMTADEFKRSGVTSLDDAQRSALEGFINRYLGAVFEMVREVGPGSRSQPTVRWGGSHRVIHNIANGELIVLEDWSIWNVSPTDRPRFLRWPALNEVAVSPAPRPLGIYRYELKNPTRDTSVLVRYVGRK